MKRCSRKIVILLACLLLLIPSVSRAYPDEEKALLSSGAVTSQADQMFLTSDNSTLYLGFNDQVSIVDLSIFGLAATQPFDFSSETDIDGIVGGIVLSNSKLYVAKEDGDMLRYDLSDIAAEPSKLTILEDTKLGKMAINGAKTRLYILDMTNNNVIVHTIGTAISATIELLDDTVSPTNFSVTNILLVEDLANSSDYIYVTTDKGTIFYIIDGETVSNKAVVTDTTDKDLISLAIRPGNGSLYVVNTTDDTLLELNPTTFVEIDSVEIIIDAKGDPTNEVKNTSLTGIVSSNNNIESSIYTYISGLKGISVLNANNTLQDIPGGTYDDSPIDTGSRFGPMVASSDSYIYMSNEGGSISVITDNPWVDITALTYSSGGSSVSSGETVTIDFTSDVDGTYSVKVGGTVAGSGTAVVDAAGDSTGPITGGSATATSFTFAYDDNSANFDEGSNTVYVFVTDSSARMGRDAVVVTVDTPPPAVTVNSTGFGNTRIYVNMNRLDISDMDHYNVYVDTDPAAVAGRTVTPVAIAQPASGATMTAEISGLSNGTLYYVAVEGVDAGGNIGPLTTTLSDGSLITEMPELTVGPAELMGEKGCSLSPRSGGSIVPQFLFGLLLFGLLILRKRQRSISHCDQPRKPRSHCESKGRSNPVIVLSVVLLLLLLIPQISFAEEASPQYWTTELKGGFWMPQNRMMKNFFGTCCNMTGNIEQSFLYDSKYGAEIGVGIIIENGTALGATSGTLSQDRFNLFLVPMETSFVFRADFKENQILVPYVKVGVDYVYFRQSLKGTTINGVKYGLHAVGGIQILLDIIDSGAQATMERDWGINDVYFTLEGKYSWINNFGSGGLDLSSLICSFGLLFEY